MRNSPSGSSRSPNSPGLVVLDIDGTLTDTVTLHQAAMRVALDAFDFPVLEPDWSRYRHHTDSGIFAEAWQRAGRGNPAEADRHRFFARFEDAFARLCPLHPIREIPGAAAFVALVRATGWAVAFATGGLRTPARAKLRAIGIAFTEPALVTASEFLSREEIVSAAIAAARIAPDGRPAAVISVGDGLWDLQAADHLGLGFLGVGTGAKAEALAGQGAAVVPDFTDPVRVLRIISDMAANCPAALRGR
ncbi:HAD family hydrolase [Rhodovastum atsumiense]|nr:HAD family hydrolase [Rhodovastum atsumiense]CAH2602222.1 HAD family hydrolase [Rhodovastum atsumiense]